MKRYLTLTLTVLMFLTSMGLTQTKKMYVNVASENLRTAPQGAKLGSLLDGTELTVLVENDDWVKVQVTGWIWKKSLTNFKASSTKGTFHALHILVKTKAEAEAIMADLKAGKDFKKIAQQKSISPSAAVGGDLGYFNKGDFDASIENAIVGLKIDQLSGIVETQFGYNIFKRIK